MLIGFILLLASERPIVSLMPRMATERPFIRSMPTIEIERQEIFLLKKPKLGEKVTITYKIVPKQPKKDARVIFHGLRGLKLVSKDSVFNFSAERGTERRFSIEVEYFATPASCSAIVEGAYNGVSITRYLLNAETGEYGSRKEIQFNPPLEYRFNPNLRNFEQMVANFEDDRWNKNHAIIDTIKSVAPEISDSLCLLLYADLAKVTYPTEIVGLAGTAEYLLKQGWQEYKNEFNRNVFLNQLKAQNEEYLSKLARNRLSAQRKSPGWFFTWLAFVILLIILETLLLRIPRLRQNRASMPTKYDKIIRYAIYVLTISIAVYFVWTYYSIKIQAPREKPRIRVSHDKRALYEIKRLKLLKDFSNFRLSSERGFYSESGSSADFNYIDKKHSKSGVQYCFTVNVRQVPTGYQLNPPAYSVIKAIEKFEGNKQVFSFLAKNRIKKAQLNFFDSLFSVTVNDTIKRDSVRIPLLIEYSGANDLVTQYIVPADFRDEYFPELQALSEWCENWGHRIKNNAYIMGMRQSQYDQPRLIAFVENGGNDTLHISFGSENYNCVSYYWSPVPNAVQAPESIIDQINTEFSKAGLPSAYVQDHIKLVRSRAFRRPDYFTYDETDRAIIEASFKWITGCDWVDEMNNHEGVQFTVVYEYFSDSLKLGKALGVPTTNGDQMARPLRPIGLIISKKEAWKRLFSLLPDEEGFNAITLRLIYPQVPNRPGELICLVGQYVPRGSDVSYEVMVDLETGEIVKPRWSWNCYWDEYEMLETHSFPIE